VQRRTSARSWRQRNMRALPPGQRGRACPRPAQWPPAGSGSKPAALTVTLGQPSVHLPPMCRAPTEGSNHGGSGVRAALVESISARWRPIPVIVRTEPAHRPLTSTGMPRSEGSAPPNYCRRHVAQLRLKWAGCRFGCILSLLTGNHKDASDAGAGSAGQAVSWDSASPLSYTQPRDSRGPRARHIGSQYR
jgi:hypothetical protein